METEGRVGETIPVRHRGAWLSVSCRHRPGNGRGLLYLHGLGGTKEDFFGAWNEADWKEYALVALDAPGCGATRGCRRGVPLGVDDIVDVAEAVVERLNVGRLTVVGHSMGGLAGLLFTLRNGRRVERLVSVELRVTSCRRTALSTAEGYFANGSWGVKRRSCEASRRIFGLERAQAG